MTYVDTIRVECIKCDHKADVAVSTVRATLPDDFKVLDLPQVLRPGNVFTKPVDLDAVVSEIRSQLAA